VNQTPHPHGRIFTASVGLGHDPVDDDWEALESEYLWFSQPPRQVCRGDHIFILGAGRRSAVLGLAEVLSGGPEEIPNPWDPDRWPWALHVRPLASVPPRLAESVPSVTAPRATAARIWDPSVQRALYSALERG
jgi:hypothetical protein